MQQTQQTLTTPDDRRSYVRQNVGGGDFGIWGFWDLGA